VYHHGTLYGTTPFGGNPACTWGCGTVYALNSATGVKTVLYAFPPFNNGFLSQIPSELFY
jgi:uncharacterized repeat protein (TIGR03803 family)